MTSGFTSPFNAPPGDTLPDDTLPNDVPQDDELLTKADDDSSKIDQAPDLFSVDEVEGKNGTFLVRQRRMFTPNQVVTTQPNFIMAGILEQEHRRSPSAASTLLKRVA